MDPDKALEVIHALIGDIDKINAQPEVDPEVNMESLRLTSELLAITITGLDVWLSAGGFLPKAWRRS